MPGAFGPVSGPAPSARRRSRTRPRPNRALTASTWSPRSPPPPPTRRQGAVASGGLRLRHQAGDPPPSRPPGHRGGGPGVDPGRRRAGSPARRRVPLQRPGRPDRRRLRHRRHPRPARAGAGVRICLGHQLLATALGAATYKLPFGHHGGNHPVRRVATNTVEITSQNHNYAVAPRSLPAADVTHVNLNDGVIEGLACRDVPAFGVQYHPEAGPGPHDASYLFEEFRGSDGEGRLSKCRDATTWTASWSSAAGRS